MCLWKFSHKETLQQTSFDRSWIILAKRAMSRFVPSTRDLGITYTVHLWLVGKRVVNFLLLLIEHFSPMVEALWADNRRNRCIVFERGVGGSLWAQISRGMGRRPPATVGSRKLQSPWDITWHSLHDPTFSSSDTILATIQQIDRHTHTHTYDDG